MARASLQSLERALAVLEALRGESPSLGLTDLATRLCLPKSTAHRLLFTLSTAGFLARTPEGKYRLGLRLWELGCAAVHGLSVRDAARPIMEDLVRRTGETVHLSVLEQGGVVYIDRVDGTNPIRLHSTIGGRAPAHATASGLALLASQDAATCVAAERHLPRFTSRTITTPAALRRTLQEVRRQGFASSAGAWYEGSAGVAAPIRSHAGTVVAGLSIAGPAERITDRVAELSALVKEAAAQVSRLLGAPASERFSGQNAGGPRPLSPTPQRGTRTPRGTLRRRS